MFSAEVPDVSPGKEDGPRETARSDANGYLSPGQKWSWEPAVPGAVFPSHQRSQGGPAGESERRERSPASPGRCGGTGLAEPLAGCGAGGSWNPPNRGAPSRRLLLVFTLKRG